MKRNSSFESSASGIITQQQFDAYADQWMSLISGPESGTLQQLFRSGKTKEVLTYAGFTIWQIVSLVSTVGAAHIKARYLMNNDDPAKPRFVLALFATDSMDTRLSPYYIAEDYQRIAVAKPTVTVTSSESSLGHVAHILAQEWASNWSALPVSDVTPALFTNTYGPMRGYNFRPNDFAQLFMGITSFGNKVVRADFGLHEYANAKAESVATFGLILRTYKQVEGFGLAEASNALFYDMASPCPPICGY